MLKSTKRFWGIALALTMLLGMVSFGPEIYAEEITGSQAKLLFPPGMYDSVEYVENSRFIVRNGDEYGLTDKEGQFIIPMGMYDGVWPGAWGYVDGHFTVEKDGEIGILDKDGQLVFPMGMYDWVEYIGNGRFMVSEMSPPYRVGMADKDGQLIVPLGMYEEFFPMRNGFFVHEDGEWGVIDKDGQIVFPLGTFDDAVLWDDGAIPVNVVVAKDGKWGLVGNGEIIVPLIHEYKSVWPADWAGEYFMGETYDGSVWGSVLLDKSFSPVFPEKIHGEYDYVWPAGDGYFEIDKGSESITVDKDGQKVFPGMYINVWYLNNGRFVIYNSEGAGIVDKDGQVILPLGTIQRAYSMGGGEDRYSKDGYIGVYGINLDEYGNNESWVIDKNNQIVSPLGGDAWYFGDGVFRIGDWNSNTYYVHTIELGPEPSEPPATPSPEVSPTPDTVTPSPEIPTPSPEIPSPTPTPETTDDCCIDYSEKDLVVDGSAQDFTINLTTERLGIPVNADFTAAAFSTDGGAKWKNIKPEIQAPRDDKNPLNSRTSKGKNNFAKLLGKGMTLHLSDKPYNSKTKSLEDGAFEVKFPKIEPAKPLPKLAVNYLFGANEKSCYGEFDGQWVLMTKVKKGQAPQIAKDDIQIAAEELAMGGLAVRIMGAWGKFYSGETNGVCVRPLQKNEKGKDVVVKRRYFYRVPPSGDGTTANPYTAASKPKKITATSQQKTPKYKVDTKKSIIKYKANTYVSINGGVPELKLGKGELPIADGNTYEFWMAATVKKSASAKLKIGH
ncbi:MAG: WG repeat-containing protein [Oscillospiraceae bacterium]|nr:WG repeat-containing protein [Oscillospiraceae bacterium]